jgi:hypothetical protein
VRLLILGAGWLLLIVLGLGIIPVHFDEAQYATWLAQPDLSYQTKGPWVTFSQSVIHELSFLPQLVQVRLPAWFAWLGSAVLLVWLGWLAGFEREHSIKLVLLFVTSPMLLALGAVHTTDIWLLFFMLLALGAFASVLHCRPGTQPELWWMLMGGALGFGALAKLSIALVPLSLLPWVILRNPRLIFTPGPYLGALFCALCMSPWIIWNDANGWAHLQHEFGHVNSSTDSIWHAIDWIPALLVASIPVMLLAVFGAISMRVDQYITDAQTAVREMLRASFITLVVFFVIKGLFGQVLLNWALPLVPVILMALALRLKWTTGAVVTTGLVQVGILLALLFPYGLGLSKEQDAFQKIRGWDETVLRAAELAGPTDVLSADHYSTLAWALFFWPSEVRDADRYQIPLGQVIPDVSRRKNQYDHWGVLNTPHSRIVHLGSDSPALASRCGTFRSLGQVPQLMPDGTIRSMISVYECLDFNPSPAWPEITQF